MDGIWAGIFHIFFPSIVSRQIGWAASPFEFEIGVADLALGIAAAISFRRSLSFTSSVATYAILFYIGVAVGRFHQAFARGDCRQATVEGQRSGSNCQTGPSGIAFVGVSENLAAAVRIREENMECPLPMSELSKRVNVSRRQLERLFARVRVGVAFFKMRPKRAWHNATGA